MSRTTKGKKGPGFDYWSRRPGNESGCNSPGEGVKRRTHKLERIQAKREIKSSQPEADEGVRT